MTRSLRMLRLARLASGIATRLQQSGRGLAQVVPAPYAWHNLCHLPLRCNNVTM